MMPITPTSLEALASALIFAAFAVTTVAGALIAVVAHRLVRSVSGLALAFLGLAGLYYYLHSPFLALMQILIYVGAICVTIMFALMLAELHLRPRLSRGREIALNAMSVLLAGLLSLGLIVVLGAAAWKPAVPGRDAVTIQDVGRAMLTPYGLAFELTSVVLLLAILGALVVARSGRRTRS